MLEHLLKISSLAGNDYPLIGDALLQALERHLGTDWNPEVEQAWTLGYQKISELMIEGTRTVKKSNVNLFTRNPTTNSQNSRSINARASTENNRSTNSASTSIFRRGTLFIGIGITMLLGYGGWMVMQTQLTNSTQPSPLDRKNVAQDREIFHKILQKSKQQWIADLALSITLIQGRRIEMTHILLKHDRRLHSS
jgi:hypothetical protein